VAAQPTPTLGEIDDPDAERCALRARAAALEAENAALRRALARAADRADLTASEAANMALRRANAALAESRAAREAAEARLRLAHEAAGVGFWEWDPGTGENRWSPEQYALFGLDPARDGSMTYARFLAEVVHPEDRAAVEAAVGEAVRTGRYAVEFRIRRGRPDGDSEVRWVLGRGRRLAAGADGAPGLMVGANVDITERRAAEERRRLVLREMGHRVKNTMAAVQSVARQTMRASPDLATFAAAFEARLLAMARAHDLLTREDWAGAALGEVVRAALEPHASGAGARLDLSGREAAGAVLAPGAALALSMALHELATNALKHGAWSAPGGRVEVSCGADPDGGGGAAIVEWTERGGPPVPPGPPARRGFGLRLMERGLGAEAGLAVDLRFEPAGVRCALRLRPAAGGTPHAAADAGPSAGTGTRLP
jgi:PAS domain S-box-containing protein